MYGTSLPSLLKKEKREIRDPCYSSIDECYEVKFVISNAVILHVKKNRQKNTKTRVFRAEVHRESVLNRGLSQISGQVLATDCLRWKMRATKSRFFPGNIILVP